tara:strand:- start:523 stop:726 length:204 start_codon:yes stop_codon:yes gene_type:complete
MQDVNYKIQPDLPITLQKIKTFLESNPIKCTINNDLDGRTNSCLDENIIINKIMTNLEFIDIVKILV